MTLRRVSSEEKVGLTLCYGSADDDVTDIFISEVEPYSVAARDGRIKEGDQIIQVCKIVIKCYYVDMCLKTLKVLEFKVGKIKSWFDTQSLKFQKN